MNIGRFKNWVNVIIAVLSAIVGAIGGSAMG